MLCGYPPFYDEHPFGIYEKILAGKIVFPTTMDPNAKDLIKKLLTADRTKRIGNLKVNQVFSCLFCRAVQMMSRNINGLKAWIFRNC
jgi:serine/threonine protein kinase